MMAKRFGRKVHDCRLSNRQERLGLGAEYCVPLGELGKIILLSAEICLPEECALFLHLDDAPFWGKFSRDYCTKSYSNQQKPDKDRLQKNISRKRKKASKQKNI